MNRKDANIGATVSMLKMIHVITPNAELPEALAGLFTEEAKDCDYQMTSDDDRLLCTRGKNDANPCTVGNCPLGAEVDEAAKENDFPTIIEYAAKREKERTFGCDPEYGNDRMMLYGKNTMGGHIHIGYTGWRKIWNRTKLCVINLLLRIVRR